MKNETRYIITDCVSIPVCKTDAYKQAVKPGWGCLEWYSKINNYARPVNRDRSDKTQQLICDDDCSAILYLKYGKEFVIMPYEEINIKDIPTQAETDIILLSDACGFTFWEKENGSIKIYVTYDENGLIDTYRLDVGESKLYDGEVEINFEGLQSKHFKNYFKGLKEILFTYYESIGIYGGAWASGTISRTDEL